MHHIWKSAAHLQKVATLEKVLHTRRNAPHLEKRTAPFLEKCTALAKVRYT